MRIHTSHGRRLVLISEWNSGNPTDHGLFVMGLKALPGYSGTNGERLALSDQTVSICPHPSRGEVDCPRQTSFWNLSFFLPHAPPYTWCFSAPSHFLPLKLSFGLLYIRKDLVAITGLVDYKSINHCKTLKSFIIIFFNVQLWETVSGISGICKQVGRQAGGVLEARTAFPTSIPTLFPSPATRFSTFYIF